ncbi:MAG: phosphatidate cytidylyltransferase [bacterium]|nr:phosphatidate cytidylyltransferase [bacterium]
MTTHSSPSADLPTDSPSDRGAPLSNLAQRLLTAVILIPVVAGAVLIGGWAFTLAVLGTAGLALLEFYGLARHWVNRARSGRAFRSAAAFLFGIVYIAVPALMLVALRGMANGVVWICLVFALTWGTDTFAYIGGRVWGRTPLAPKISPNKTREGALTGVAGAFSVSLVLLVLTGQYQPAFLLLLAAAPIAATLGDLTESAIKRAAAVKDSHLFGLNIFPGHGGVLDRVDSLLFVTVVTYGFLLMVQRGVAI